MLFREVNGRTMQSTDFLTWSTPPLQSKVVAAVAAVAAPLSGRRPSRTTALSPRTRTRLPSRSETFSGSASGGCVTYTAGRHTPTNEWSKTRPCHRQKGRAHVCDVGGGGVGEDAASGKTSGAHMVAQPQQPRQMPPTSVPSYLVAASAVPEVADVGAGAVMVVRSTSMHLLPPQMAGGASWSRFFRRLVSLVFLNSPGLAVLSALHRPQSLLLLLQRQQRRPSRLAAAPASTDGGEDKSAADETGTGR